MLKSITVEHHVGLFVTCLVDLTRPSIGFATLKLLKHTEYRAFVPERQTCCGQPTNNAGDYKITVDIAKQVIETFEDFDYLAVSSGSCGGMGSLHYATLFEDGGRWKTRANKLAKKTFELITFLPTDHYSK